MFPETMRPLPVELRYAQLVRGNKYDIDENTWEYDIDENTWSFKIDPKICR